MMPSFREEDRIATGSLVLLAVVGAALILHYTQYIMIPFIVAILISTLASPVLDFQVLRLKFPRILAAAVTLLLVMAVLAVLCLFATQAIQMIISTTSRYSDNLIHFVNRMFQNLDEWGVKVEKEEIITGIRNRIPRLVQNTFGTMMGFITSFLMTTIFIIFLLGGRNPHVIRGGVYADIDLRIRRYIATKVAVSVVTGILVWIILSAFRLELAPVFGMLACLLNFIPSLGSIVATLLPIPVAIAQFQSPWLVFLVVLVPGMVQMLIGNFIEPKLLGKGMNLHPVTILLSLAFWGLLWGFVGMFLAVPITAIIRIIFMRFETLKPLGKLLAGELPNFAGDKGNELQQTTTGDNTI